MEMKQEEWQDNQGRYRRSGLGTLSKACTSPKIASVCAGLSHESSRNVSYGRWSSLSSLKESRRRVDGRRDSTPNLVRKQSRSQHDRAMLVVDEEMDHEKRCA